MTAVESSSAISGRTQIGPRKAYRVTGQVVCITESGRQFLLQWKSSDDMWTQRTFVVLNGTVVVAGDGDLAHWKAALPDRLQTGDVATIDYQPLGPQHNLALAVFRKESDFEPKPTVEMEQALDEAFRSSTAEVAAGRVAVEKACA